MADAPGGKGIGVARKSEGAGARTRDPRIKSPLLCRLSYALAIPRKTSSGRVPQERVRIPPDGLRAKPPNLGRATGRRGSVEAYAASLSAIDSA